MIQGSIQITMANIQALRTTEISLTERHILNVESALVASMTASSCFGVLSEFSTACDSFVGEHPIEISPRNVKYVFCEIASDHVLNVELFTADDSETFCEGVACFVQEVTPLVSDFQVLSRKLDTSLLPIIAALDTLTVYPLQPSKLPFSLKIESWVSDAFSFVVSQESFQPNINTYHLLIRVLDCRSIKFTGEHCEPLISFVSLDSHSLDFSFRQPVEYDWYAANLGTLQSRVGQEFESALWICNALNPALESRKSSLDFDALLSQLYPSEKVVNSFVKPVRNILQHLRMSLGIVFRSCFHIRDKRVEVVSTRKKMLFVLSKKSVIHFLANLELIEKPDLLFSRRIQPVLIHPEFHRGECYG
jgi:hypothetical protein